MNDFFDLLNGFRINGDFPIDSRFVVADEAARLAIPVNAVYKGLFTFQADVNLLYIYDGEDQTNVDSAWTSFTVNNIDVANVSFEIAPNGNTIVTLPFENGQQTQFVVQRGETGPEAQYFIEVIGEFAEDIVVQAPEGGSYDTETRVLDTTGLTAGWFDPFTQQVPALADGNAYYRARFIIIPARVTGSVTPTWSSPVQLSGDQGPQGQTGPTGADGNDGDSFFDVVQTVVPTRGMFTNVQPRKQDHNGLITNAGDPIRLAAGFTGASVTDVVNVTGGDQAGVPTTFQFQSTAENGATTILPQTVTVQPGASGSGSGDVNSTGTIIAGQYAKFNNPTLISGQTGVPGADITGLSTNGNTDLSTILNDLDSRDVGVADIRVQSQDIVLINGNGATVGTGFRILDSVTSGQATPVQSNTLFNEFATKLDTDLTNVASLTTQQQTDFRAAIGAGTGSSGSDVDDLAITGSTLQVTENGTPTGTGIRVEASVMDEDGRLVSSKAVFDGLADKLDKSGGTITGDLNVNGDLEVGTGATRGLNVGTNGDFHLTMGTVSYVQGDQDQKKLYYDKDNTSGGVDTSDDNEVMNAGGLEIGATSIGHTDHPDGASEDAQIILGYDERVISRLPVDVAITSTAATNFIQNNQSGRINFVLSDTVQASDQKPATSAAVNTYAQADLGIDPSDIREDSDGYISINTDLVLEDNHAIDFEDSSNNRAASIGHSDSNNGLQIAAIATDENIYLLPNGAGKAYVGSAAAGNEIVTVGTQTGGGDVTNKVDKPTIHDDNLVHSYVASSIFINQDNLATEEIQEKGIHLDTNDHVVIAGQIEFRGVRSDGSDPLVLEVDQAGNGDIVLCDSEGSAILTTVAASGGAFLGDKTVPANQIATIGDISGSGGGDATVRIIQPTGVFLQILPTYDITGGGGSSAGEWYIRENQDTNTDVEATSWSDWVVENGTDATRHQIFFDTFADADENPQSNDSNAVVMANAAVAQGYVFVQTDTGSAIVGVTRFSGTTSNDWRLDISSIINSIGVPGTSGALRISNLGFASVGNDDRTPNGLANGQMLVWDHALSIWRNVSILVDAVDGTTESFGLNSITEGAEKHLVTKERLDQLYAPLGSTGSGTDVSVKGTGFNDINIVDDSTNTTSVRGVTWAVTSAGELSGSVSVAGLGTGGSDGRFQGAPVAAGIASSGVTVSAVGLIHNSLGEAVTVILPSANPTTPFAIGEHVHTTDADGAVTYVISDTFVAQSGVVEIIINGDHRTAWQAVATADTDIFIDRTATPVNTIFAVTTPGAGALQLSDSLINVIEQENETNKIALANEAKVDSLLDILTISTAWEAQGTYLTTTWPGLITNHTAGQANSLYTSPTLRVFPDGRYEFSIYASFPTDELPASFTDEFGTATQANKPIAGIAFSSSAYDNIPFPHVLQSEFIRSQPLGTGGTTSGYGGRHLVVFGGILTDAQNADRSFIQNASDTFAIYGEYSLYAFYPNNDVYDNFRVGDPAEIFAFTVGIYDLYQLHDMNTDAAGNRIGLEYVMFAQGGYVSAWIASTPANSTTTTGLTIDTITGLTRTEYTSIPRFTDTWYEIADVTITSGALVAEAGRTVWTTALTGVGAHASSFVI